jgi:DNA repair protein RadC
LARRQLLENLQRGLVLDSPETTKRYFHYHLGQHQREVFSCLFLDSQHTVICCEDLFWGTIDGASVHPREVLIRVLHHTAAAVIFAHNHPSGIAEPSQADRRITERLVEALKLIDVKVLDHIVVGSGEQLSFTERGLL